jgi:NADPH2 dehydrogenase
VDLIDCSSGGVVNVRPRAWAAYQVRFATHVRRASGLPVVAVGLLSRPEEANEIIRQGRADIIALGRSLLRMPYWANYAARTLGRPAYWPAPYVSVDRTPVFPER